MNSDDSHQSRYSRFIHLPLIGQTGMKKIRKTRATVVGCGGLGSVTAAQLTSLGIGYLRLIDNDIIERSNLQRQTLYREKDIGKPKVEIAKKFLEELNPDVTIEVIRETINEETVELASQKVDFIVDAVDSFTPRFILNREALKKDIPFLFGAVSGMTGNVMTIQRGSVCIECLFNNVNDNTLPNSSITGIHPSIIQIIGSIQIAEATKLMINKKPTLLNTLLFCDIESMQFDSIDVKPRENCSCGIYY
ncbi:MAG: HesA/MoeB/ThiF family protein [Candidatus Heimdallarchaeota archaeon]|nr:HesA/MoeB/ThiF family protein [Candidatus Heimdallarchaeota archaeon]